MASEDRERLLAAILRGPAHLSIYLPGMKSLWRAACTSQRTCLRRDQETGTVRTVSLG